MAAKELPAIIQAHTQAGARGEPAALATVVQTSGSTYRRAGARMWIGADGRSIGAISGGCLEDDTRDRAQEVMASGEPALIHYDTTADGDILWGSGIGCQGVVHVLVEPLPPHGNTALDQLAAGLDARQTAVLATVFRARNTPSVRAGDFLWCTVEPNDDHASANLLDSSCLPAIRREAHRALREASTQALTCPLPDGGEVDVLFDVVRPPQSLLIMGAGHDAVPLAGLAAQLGWRVRVADRRRAYAVREHFPEATAVIHAPSGALGTTLLPVEPGEAVMVMTHNYLQDLTILRALLPTEAGYIGLLGPSRRKERLLHDLLEDPFGVVAAEDDDGGTDRHGDTDKKESDPVKIVPAAWLEATSLSRVHGPAGLDIGAEAPEQIALSILAEIEAYTAKRRGGPLKDRLLPLHDPLPQPLLPSASLPTEDERATRDAAVLTAS